MRRPRLRAREDGLTLIEVLVAIVLLAIIIVPIATLVIQSSAATNQVRLRSEALNLAADTLETAQNEAKFIVPTIGTSTGNESVAVNGPGTQSDQFTIATTYNFVDDSNASLCDSASGKPTDPSVYVVTAQVTWPGSPPAGVQESTYVAPQEAGEVPQVSAQLAVPVDDGVTGLPYTQPVDITVSAVDPTADANTVTYATGNSGTSGCVVFPNLNPNDSYDVYLGSGTVGATTPPTPVAVNQTSVVNDDNQPELVNMNTPTDPSVPFQQITPPPAGVTTVTNAFAVDPGVTVNVTFQPVTATPSPTGVGCTIADDNSIIAPTELPVTLQTGAGSTANTYDFNAGTNLVSLTSIQAYPNTYTAVWAGDTVESAPSFALSNVSVYGPCAAAPQLNVTDGEGSTSITIPVYPALFQTAGLLSATEVSSPQQTIELSAPQSGKSSNGLPLGEYVLSASNGSPLTSPYIWVTPTKVWYGTTQQTSPSGFTQSASPGTPIPE